MIYKFTIEYYCERYHNGDLNYLVTRTCVVFAKNRDEAVSKARLVDDNYISIKNMTFEQIEKDGGVMKNDR